MGWAWNIVVQIQLQEILVVQPCLEEFGESEVMQHEDDCVLQGWIVDLLIPTKCVPMARNPGNMPLLLPSVRDKMQEATLLRIRLVIWS